MLAELAVIDCLDLFIAPKMLGDGVHMIKVPSLLIPASEIFVSHKWNMSGPDMHFRGIMREY
jgi:riboflavin biosynthesis pyrimidine reductase